MQAKPPRRRLRSIFSVLAVDVARLGQPQHGAERAQIERAGRLVWLHFDRPDAHAGLALDHHSVAALERQSAGEKVVKMADRKKADCDNPRQFRSAFERVDLLGHYWLLSASRTVIHHCSACIRGFAISSIAALASTAPLRLTSSASRAKLSAIFVIVSAISGAAAAGGVRISLRHSISSSTRAINSKFSAACSRLAKNSCASADGGGDSRSRDHHFRAP